MPWGVAAAAVVGAYSSNKASKKAAEAQTQAGERSEQFLREGVANAKKDINKYFPQAQEMTAGGFQGALDAFGQFMPQQAELFQQGNVGAQNALLSGLPQMQNAILGNPIDYSGMQAQTLSYDPSMFQQQLPNSVTGVDPNQPIPGPDIGTPASGMWVNPSNQGGYLSSFGNGFNGVFGSGGGFAGGQTMPNVNNQYFTTGA